MVNCICTNCFTCHSFINLCRHLILPPIGVIQISDTGPVAERVAVDAANRDLFTIYNKLMNLDHMFKI
jgi:hypothetical protein